MRTGFVSESLVIAGTYSIVNGQAALGGTMLGCGVFGGLFSFMYNVTLAQSTEKRRSEIFEISKGLLAKLLQAFQDVNAISQKIDRTVH